MNTFFIYVFLQLHAFGISTPLVLARFAVLDEVIEDDEWTDNRNDYHPVCPCALAHIVETAC